MLYWLFISVLARFHVLTEFDEAKRSCRKRLAEHNRRRRKPAASNTAGSKDSAPPSKKPSTGAMSGSYTADNNSKLTCTSFPSSYLVQSIISSSLITIHETIEQI
jgi:hypothetical protein